MFEQYNGLAIVRKPLSHQECASLRVPSPHPKCINEYHGVSGQNISDPAMNTTGVFQMVDYVLCSFWSEHRAQRSRRTAVAPNDSPSAPSVERLASPTSGRGPSPPSDDMRGGRACGRSRACGGSMEDGGAKQYIVMNYSNLFTNQPKLDWKTWRVELGALETLDLVTCVGRVGMLLLLVPPIPVSLALALCINSIDVAALCWLPWECNGSALVNGSAPCDHGSA